MGWTWIYCFKWNHNAPLSFISRISFGLSFISSIWSIGSSTSSIALLHLNIIDINNQIGKWIEYLLPFPMYSSWRQTERSPRGFVYHQLIHYPFWRMLARKLRSINTSFLFLLFSFHTVSNSMNAYCSDLRVLRSLITSQQLIFPKREKIISCKE